jgi:hypothetical protein
VDPNDKVQADWVVTDMCDEVLGYANKMPAQWTNVKDEDVSSILI